jgi:hypothetical protein
VPRQAPPCIRTIGVVDRSLTSTVERSKYQSHVNKVTGWNRSSLQYRPEGRDEAALPELLRYWAALKSRWGVPILHDVLKAKEPRASSLITNAPSAYREGGLSLRCKRRRKLPAVARVSLSAPKDPMNAGRVDGLHP